MYRRTYLSRTPEENKKWFELAGRELTASEWRTKMGLAKWDLVWVTGGFELAVFELAWFYYCFHNEFFSCHPNNDFIFKIQVVSRAVGPLERDEKSDKVDVKIMSTTFAALWKILFVSYAYAQG